MPAPAPPSPGWDQGSQDEQTSLPSRTFSEGPKGWSHLTNDYRKGCSCSDLKTTSEPMAQSAWHIGMLASGKILSLHPPGAPLTGAGLQFPRLMSMMFSQHQKIQSERKRKRQILSATSNIGKQMFAFLMDFLVSCGILIMPHALG